VLIARKKMVVVDIAASKVGRWVAFQMVKFLQKFFYTTVGGQGWY